MKNKEKYAQEMISIILSGCKIAISRKHNRPINCLNCDCKDCYLNVDARDCYSGVCIDKLNEWAEEEYEEPPILDEKEKEFLQFQYDHIHPEIIEFMKIDCKLYENGECYEVESISYKTKNKEKRTFPIFKKGSMYKGMNLGEYYTPEELGLKVKK